MGNTRRKPTTGSQIRRGRPATTPEGRENQLIALAVDEAERQIRTGEASAQVITHFLKLGSSRERLEHEKMVRENKLLDARVDQIESGARMEELYSNAINAMRGYAGEDEIEYMDD